jgi:dihydroflavonol-4-reductase
MMDDGERARVPILVTGATGFLGGAITRALVRRGDRVRALVRPSSRAEALDALDALGVERAAGDVLDPPSVRAAARGCKAILHAAGILGRAGARDDEYTRVHEGGIVSVLHAARDERVARVLHMSSPGILGPIRGGPADEDAPLHPTNVYERAKAAAERAVRAFEREHGPTAVMVRPEFVYGPGDYHVLRLFQAIQRGHFFFVGSGGALCHPTFVDDAVCGVLAALDRAPLGRTFHLAGPRPVTIRELACAFADALGGRPPRLHVPELAVRAALRALRPVAGALGRELPIDASGVDFFTFDRQFSIRRAKAELGYEPRVDVPDGARRAVIWYRQRRLLT